MSEAIKCEMDNCQNEATKLKWFVTNGKRIMRLAVCENHALKGTRHGEEVAA